MRAWLAPGIGAALASALLRMAVGEGVSLFVDALVVGQQAPLRPMESSALAVVPPSLPSLPTHCRSPLAARPVFDPMAGDGRVISEDGCSLTSSGASCNVFRGRTVAMRAGPGVAVDIVLEVTVGRKPDNVTIALGGCDRLLPNT